MSRLTATAFIDDMVTLTWLNKEFTPGHSSSADDGGANQAVRGGETKDKGESEEEREKEKESGLLRDEDGKRNSFFFFFVTSDAILGSPDIPKAF